MKSFLVLGLGRFGKNLARSLFEQGCEVVAVDVDPRKTQDIAEEVTHAVTADCQDKAVLKSLDAASFDCAVVAMSKHVEASILITFLLKEMGVKYVLVKASSTLNSQILRQVGADRIVFPEKDMAVKVAQSLSFSNILDFIELSSEFSIIEITVPKKWVGKSLRELNVRRVYSITVVARKDGANGMWEVSIDPDGLFRESDILVVVGTNDDVSKVAE